uniref:PHD finger protein 10 n=1 Tax=Phallusia mammillata TaxID=59560 RepID=A0A6F9DPA8_9ASCI|nr:ZF(PHD)-1 PHD finger protein 10 [Phallusia mammillata]
MEPTTEQSVNLPEDLTSDAAINTKQITTETQCCEDSNKTENNKDDSRLIGQSLQRNRDDAEQLNPVLGETLQQIDNMAFLNSKDQHPYPQCYHDNSQSPPLVQVGETPKEQPNVTDNVLPAEDLATAPTAEQVKFEIVDDEVVNLLDSVVNQICLVVVDEKETKEKEVVVKPVTVEVKSKPAGVSHTGRVIDPICLQQNIFSSIVAENLVEYQWPADSSGDYYMLQEQVSTFLSITSFKRKYPEIQRRKLDPAEVNHLLAGHFISEVQVTLGLTALKSSDVCDMMAKEYPEKYNEYQLVMQEREKQKLQNKYKEYASSSVQVEKSQMPGYLKKAMKQAAAYNASLNRQRRDEFAAYYDMQTNVLQYPRNKVRKLDPELTRPSLYPCALIPGQFQEYYKTYTRNDMMFMPMTTALYGPPHPNEPINDIESSGSEVDSEPDSVTTLSSVPHSIRSISSAKPKDRSVSARSSIAGDVQPMETNQKETNQEEGGENDESENEESGPFNPICGICGKDETCNKKDEPEDLIKCSQCDNHGHPTCLEMSSDLVSVILTYNWQCMECKTCTICSMPHREDLMMFCDRCDRGYHTFCVSLRAIPSGVWACSRCTHADPDFLRRRRKQLKQMLGIKSTRGRGGRRRGRGGRRGEPKTTVEVDMDDSVMSIDSLESSQQGKIDEDSNTRDEIPNTDTPPVDDEGNSLLANIDDNAQHADVEQDHVFQTPENNVTLTSDTPVADTKPALPETDSSVQSVTSE